MAKKISYELDGDAPALSAAEAQSGAREAFAMLEDSEPQWKKVPKRKPSWIDRFLRRR